MASTPGPIEAVIFDTDGVVTRTATVHLAAWRRVFDDELQHHLGPDAEPFTDEDYRRDVDGRPRQDGVAAFLASRGIHLPLGSPGDPPGHDTVHAVGNTKNDAFLAEVAAHGVDAYPSTIGFVDQLRTAGIRVAVVSASKNCALVLEAAGVADRFELRVDGTDAERLGLAGKPDPALFLEAARRLEVDPSRAAVVEDAIAGVEAARRGRFGLVIGVDRVGHPEDLAAADLVVSDLAALTVHDGRIALDDHPTARLPDLPSALTDGDVARRLEGRRPAVFLDYDGTLTPIVARPELAVLDPATKAVLAELAARCTVGIISGRDLDDVRAMVGADGHLWFAGSHGFDIASPDGRRRDIEAGRDLLPQLDAAEAELRDAIAVVPAAWVERKRFAIAVHFRQTPVDEVPRLEAIVTEVAAVHPGLRMAGGKMIFELRPDIPWDKGRALRYVADAAGVDPEAELVVYVGDDVTDEDAFVAVRGEGLGVVVGDEDRPTAADHRLADTDEVRAFLQRLLDDLPEPR